jgi:hypothetical protein
MNFRLLTICLLLFVNLNTQAQTVINKDQIFHQATWIWYPGDYEIWLSNQMQNRRTDRGSFFPVFWKVDSHYPLIDFHKEFYLTAPEEVFIVTEGNYNVTFDGVNDQLVTPPINFTATDKMTVGIGLNVIGSASAAVALELGADVNSINGSFLIGAPSSITDHSLYLRGTTTIRAAVNNITDGDDIILGLFDISQATKETELIPRLNRVQITGANITWTGTDAGTGNFGNLPLYIGARSGLGNPYNGKIYQIIVRGGAATSDQVRNLENWIDSKLD